MTNTIENKEFEAIIKADILRLVSGFFLQYPDAKKDILDTFQGDIENLSYENILFRVMNTIIEEKDSLRVMMFSAFLDNPEKYKDSLLVDSILRSHATYFKLDLNRLLNTVLGIKARGDADFLKEMDSDENLKNFLEFYFQCLGNFKWAIANYFADNLGKDISCEIQIKFTANSEESDGE
jgi:hypothetical protein